MITPGAQPANRATTNAEAGPEAELGKVQVCLESDDLVGYLDSFYSPLPHRHAPSGSATLVSPTPDAPSAGRPTSLVALQHHQEAASSLGRQADFSGEPPPNDLPEASEDGVATPEVASAPGLPELAEVSHPHPRLLEQLSDGDLPGIEPLANFIAAFEAFEDIAFQQDYLAIFKAVPYAVRRFCDGLLDKILNRSGIRASSSDYHQFETVYRAWNIASPVLSDNCEILSAGERSYFLAVEKELRETLQQVRGPVQVTGHVALSFPEDIGEIQAPVDNMNAIPMALEHMPAKVRHFIQALQTAQAQSALPGRGKRVQRHLLLEGPPGMGKTVIAEDIARHLNGTTFRPPKNMRSIYYGQSANETRTFFEKVTKFSRQHKKIAVIFLDELDIWTPSRDTMSHGDNERRTVIQEFCTLLNPDESHFQHLVIVGATNRLADIDEAILSRFGDAVRVGMPDIDALQRAISRELSDQGFSIQQTGHLASLCIGQTLRDAVTSVRIISAHENDFSQFRRSLIDRLCEARTTDRLQAKSPPPSGFTADLQICNFYHSYQTGLVRRFFKYDNRAWSLNFDVERPGLCAGMRLYCLYGPPVKESDFKVSLTNNKKIEKFSSTLTFAGNSPLQSWYTPWACLLESSDRKPDTEFFRHTFVDDIVNIHLEVDTTDKVESHQTKQGIHLELVQKDDGTASVSYQGDGFDLTIYHDLQRHYSVVAQSLALDTPIEVIVQDLSKKGKRYANILFSVNQKVFLPPWSQKIIRPDINHSRDSFPIDANNEGRDINLIVRPHRSRSQFS